jgi:glycosyltransferase involved in cell wall biosynthesis
MTSEELHVTLPFNNSENLSPLKKKYKILMFSDHPLCCSGVGTQSRYLIEGLINTGKYSFRCLGGAIKHPSYDTVMVNPDLIIKPVDGFGTKEMLRQLLATERPDAILIFTDPRQFIWMWEVEDEIHQVCPISYWHVWDNDPYPSFNEVWYKSTDLINCLSYKTYEMVKPHFPERTNYIPHAWPKRVYYPLPKQQIVELRKNNFGDRADWFIGLWVNRNAHRKQPSDLIEGFKMFLDNLEKEEGHRKALLVMHTDPMDQEGPNLLEVSNLFGTQNNVWFSTQKLDFPNMNILHNITDYTVNIARAEGFGLATLSSMQVGRPIIALKTGGETRQVVDHRDNSTQGVAIDPVTRILTGSQQVPFIYDDFISKKDLAEAFMKLYKMTPEERAEIGKKAMAYVDFEFNYDNMIRLWDESLEKCITEWRNKETRPKLWSCTKVETPREMFETRNKQQK